MRTGADVPSVSGTLIQGLLVAAQDTLGTDVVTRGLSKAPRDARALVEAALPGAWVPIESAELTFSAIAGVAGRDWPSLHMELSRLAVDRAVKTFWRLLLRFTTDEALVTRTPVFFSKSYNRGKLTARITAPNRGEVSLLEWPNIPDWPIRGSQCGIETVLKAAGRKDVRVEGQRTATGAVYLASWK